MYIVHPFSKLSLRLTNEMPLGLNYLLIKKDSLFKLTMLVAALSFTGNSNINRHTIAQPTTQNPSLTIGLK